MRPVPTTVAVLGKGNEVEHVHAEAVSDRLQSGDRRNGEALLDVGEVALASEVRLVGELLRCEPLRRPKLADALPYCSGEWSWVSPSGHGDSRLASSCATYSFSAAPTRPELRDDDHDDGHQLHHDELQREETRRGDLTCWRTRRRRCSEFKAANHAENRRTSGQTHVRIHQLPGARSVARRVEDATDSRPYSYAVGMPLRNLDPDGLVVIVDASENCQRNRFCEKLRGPFASNWEAGLARARELGRREGCQAYFKDLGEDIELLLSDWCSAGRFDHRAQPTEYAPECQHPLWQAPEGAARPLRDQVADLHDYCSGDYLLWKERKGGAGPSVFAVVSTGGRSYVWIQTDSVPPASSAAFSVSTGELVYSERGPTDVVRRSGCMWESFGIAPTPRPSRRRSMDVCEHSALLVSLISTETEPEGTARPH